MANLATKVKLYAAANGVSSVNFSTDVLLQDDSDGNGAYIKEWNISGVTKPTNEQLASYETAGNTAESNAQVDAARKAAYGDIGAQLDMMYWDNVNGTTTWKDHVAQVKTDNPKS
jgi:hypothetical protein